MDISAGQAVQRRYLKLTAAELPYAEKFAISGLRVFGKGNADAPAAVRKANAVRTDAMTAKLTWNAVPGAQGYNVRFGEGGVTAGVSFQLE